MNYVRGVWLGVALLAGTSVVGCEAASSNRGEQSGSQPADSEGDSRPVSRQGEQNDMNQNTDSASTVQLATFGAGCFWCVEAVFQELEGVISVESGYAGGFVENPTYEAVCSGETGHAEVCQIQFDPSRISFVELLEVFWKTHDPTTLNRQGADQGTQYRSAVFYHDPSQKQLAEEYKKKLDESGAWDRPIVTEISPFTTFYKAEAYHQDYYRLNPNNGYCAFNIRPKLEKFRQVFQDKLKESAN